MIFGVFDGIHEGHRKFLAQARKLGDYLVVVVTQDHIAKHLKGEFPSFNLAERFLHLKKEDNVDEVIVGDGELRTWKILERYHPDVIALGYDQTFLKEELEAYFTNHAWHPFIRVLGAYEPETNHSSIFRSTREE